MDGERFDRLVRACATVTSRRAVLRTLVASAAAGVVAVLDPSPGLARRCRPVGHACRSRHDCCTQSCQTAHKHYRCACPIGWGDCDQTNGCEASLYNDNNNCGACGHACLPGASCSGGTCSCGGTICGQACLDTSRDVNNCGACGHACASGEVCCSGTCANTQTDPNFCGACYSSCGPFGAICVAGGCTCPEGTTSCGSGCADLASDASNCGGCGQQCPAGANCVNGSCACPDGSVACDGACVAGSCNCPGGATVCADGYCPGPYRAGHCGTCDNVCPGGENCVCGSCQFFCSGNNRCLVGANQCCSGEECVERGPFSGGEGVCSCLCPEGLSHCFSDACVNLSSDPGNCGGCGIDCGGGACVDGACPVGTPTAG